MTWGCVGGAVVGTGVGLRDAVTRCGTAGRKGARGETAGADVVTGGGVGAVVGASVVGGGDEVEVAGAGAEDRDRAGTRDSLLSTVEVETYKDPINTMRARRARLTMVRPVWRRRAWRGPWFIRASGRLAPSPRSARRGAACLACLTPPPGPRECRMREEPVWRGESGVARPRRA
jgi:hypothetical protein